MKSAGGSSSDILTPAERAAVVNGYDNGLRQMDDVVRGIFEKLTAYMKSALVFISGDHAEGLGEHGRYAHSTFIYPEVLHIPLFIYDTSDRKYPAIPFANQTDIAATAVAGVGLPVPDSWEGIDLASGRQRQWSFAENYHRHEVPCRVAFLRADKGLFYLLNCRPGEEQVFNLSSDPLGLRDIRASVDPAILAAMRARLNEVYPDYRNYNVWKLRPSLLSEQ
jgi:lipoteichoic acid synthase